MSKPRPFRIFSRDSAYTPFALPLSITPEEIATNYLRPTDKEITEAVIPINLQGKKPCKPKPKPNTYLLVKDAFDNPFGKKGGTRKRRKRKKKKNRRKTRNKKGGYRRIIMEYNKILLFDIIEWSDKMNELYKKEINHFNSLKETQLTLRKAKNMGRQEAKPTSVDDIKQLFSRLIARMTALIIKKKNRNNNKIQQINNDLSNADKEILDKKSILEIENNDLDQTSVELKRILLDGKWGGKKRRRRKSTKKKRKKRRRSTKKKKRRR